MAGRSNRNVPLSGRLTLAAVASPLHLRIQCACSILYPMATCRIGVDIGGTFTDFVVLHPESGKLETFKLLSTPHNPAEAVLQGICLITSQAPPFGIKIVHGSTVAANALLERKGARTVLITTRGFRDILQIGRQNRPSLYDLEFEPPQPLVPDDLRLEVDERVDHLGRILKSLDPNQLEDIVATLRELKPESVAVCFLFSFLHPEHEQSVAERLREEGYFVSLSSEILPEFREYERTSTTAVNAYVTPVLDRYLFSLENDLGADVQCALPRLRVMQSSGGVISPEEARRKGVHCILSGPAGGVIGSQYIARQSLKLNRAPLYADGQIRLITFDMGGTSTDVSLIEGAPRMTTEAMIGGMPIRIPLLDIHTIGAGGGSIAQVDMGGALRVGPQSAGADPGPACYGRGDLPTVTDANLVLGRLAPEYFLGGKMPLDVDRATQALEKLGEKLGLNREQTALGIVEVVNAHMERALRLISVERGYDPADFTLLSFGGAGGLHACELAQKLGIQRVLIPSYASVLSALGMLMADVSRDYSLTVMLPGDTPPETIEESMAPLIERGLADLAREGISEDHIQISRMLDMRYVGQSYELIVPYSDHYIDDFHAAHLKEYSYQRVEAPVEIVNVRVRAIGAGDPPALPAVSLAGPDPSQAYIDTRQVVLPIGTRPIPVYRGEKLLPGNQIHGPALMLRDDTTVLLVDSVTGTVDQLGSLSLDVPEGMT
jgi:N-methylhydantoinase A